MKGSQHKITGILLAGGKSKRMGHEKGNIRIGKFFMYQYPLTILEEVCDEILISTCKDLKLPKNHKQICDEVPDIGPLGGICTCLKRSSNDLNIVLSYDLPLANVGLIMHLLSESKEFDIVVPALQNGKPEPLCGIYRKGVTEKLIEMIDNKIYAVHKVLPLVKTRTILLEDSMPFYHPDIFLNINNEEDLSRLPSGFGQE